MRRAKTLTGLFFQALRTKWQAVQAKWGKTGQVLLIGGLLLAALSAVQLGFYFFGGCAAGPCSLRQSPCAAERSPCAAERARHSQGHEGQDDSPCPYSR